MSAVFKQPTCKKERLKALQALLSCPTSSIHTEKPSSDILQIQGSFPIPIDEQKLPGVYYCGYHSEKSYGAAPYLIVHPKGYILIDSPRFRERLARKIEMLGGARYIFLTHKDVYGSVCLYYKSPKILFTGNHLIMTESGKLSIMEQYNRSSVPVQPDSVQKLLDLDLKWIIPGHGRRIEFKNDHEKRVTLEAFPQSKSRQLL